MGSFVKDVFRVLKSNVVIIVVGLLNAMVTARYIGPEGNGIIAGLAVYPSLFMTIGSLGVRQSTAYFLGKDVFSEEDIKRSITQIWFFTSIVSVAICYILISEFSNSGNNSYWVILSILPIPFNLFITYNSGVFLGKNDIKTFNTVNWIPPFLTLVLIGVTVVIFKMGVTGVLISTIGGPVFMAIVMLFKNDFLSSFSIKLDWEIIKKMLSLGLIYALSLLVINLNYKADVILLDKLSTAYELGIYTKGATLTQYLWQIPMLFSTVVFARSATSKEDDKFSKKVAVLLRLSFIFIGVGCLFLYIFSKYIIVLMYGERYLESTDVLKYLLPGVLILTIYKVMNMDLAGKGKPWVAMFAMVPSLIINVVLNIIFIPKYGAAGSALCSTISYCIAGITFLIYYSKSTGISVKEILTYRKTDFTVFLGLYKKLRSR